MNCNHCKFFKQSQNFKSCGFCGFFDENVLGGQPACNHYQLPDSLAHYQLAANAQKVGGWDNAIALADAIESGDRAELERLAKPYPQGWGLIERIVEVSAAHR